MPVPGRRLPPRRDQQRMFWRLLRAEVPVEEAAGRVGISVTSGRRWFRQAGGMPPLSLQEPTRGRFLGIHDREKIHAGVNQGLSVTAIAASIDRHPSTVSRELKRNMRHDYTRRPGSPGSPRTRDWDYSPHIAQKRADANSARPKPAQAGRQRPAARGGAGSTGAGTQPEQIAARLRVDFPDDPEMRVSHETIYQSLLRARPRRAAPGPAHTAAHRPGAAQAAPQARRAARPDPGHGQHQRAPGRGRRPGGARALGGRPDHRQRTSGLRDRHPGRADHPVRHAAAPARRPRRAPRSRRRWSPRCAELPGARCAGR